MEDNFVNEEDIETVLREKGYLFHRTVGISMQPLIKEGRDAVLIKARTPERLRKYDVVLFLRPNIEGRGKYVLHRIIKVNPDGTYWIAGDNCTEGETVWEQDILGVLDAVMRKGKKVTIENRLYRIYTHLWCDCLPLRFLFLRGVHFGRKILSKIYRHIT